MMTYNQSSLPPPPAVLDVSQYHSSSTGDSSTSTSTAATSSYDSSKQGLLPSPDLSAPTTIATIAVNKPSRHAHRRSQAISQSVSLPYAPVPDFSMPSPPLTSPSLSLSHTASSESLRNDVLDPRVVSLSALTSSVPTSIPSSPRDPAKRVSFNESIVYYPAMQSQMQEVSQEDIQLPDVPIDMPDVPVETVPAAMEDTIIPSSSSSSPRHSRSQSWSLPSFRRPLRSPSPTDKTTATTITTTTTEPVSAATKQAHRRSWSSILISPFKRSTTIVRANKTYRPPTPPLGSKLQLQQQPPLMKIPKFMRPAEPVIDLDAALGTVSPSSSSTPKTTGVSSVAMLNKKLDNLNLKLHRRSESAPEIRGLGLVTEEDPASLPPERSFTSSEQNAPLYPSISSFTFGSGAQRIARQLSPDRSAAAHTPRIRSRSPLSRGLKRKMSVIDEDTSAVFASTNNTPKTKHRPTVSAELGVLQSNLEDMDLQPIESGASSDATGATTKTSDSDGSAKRKHRRSWSAKLTSMFKDASSS